MFEAISQKVKAMTADSANNSNSFILWIDRVGAWKAYLSSELTIGGPSSNDRTPADISLMANITRKHATLTRDKDTWSLEPHAGTRLGDRKIESRVPLRSDASIHLGSSVELQFRVPTALSSTAVLDFVSGHRPAQSVDGIVLVHENVLLGPGPENHIVCPDWPDSVVLFRRDGDWQCKSRMNLAVDGDIVTDSHVVRAGSVIAGEDFRMRIEAVQS